MQNLAQRHATRQSTLGSALDSRAVSHRIGERDAQFDHVGAGFDQGMHQWHGQVCARITRGDERNQRLAALAIQAFESFLNARHQKTIPDFSATVCMSLSPRPERLTSRILSLPSVGANLAA
ncbi:hypothetical protein SDC9_149757 [bioreactor metagenome]|uniref:Uncharacterized protein n=1 Tax=bioreactor metagenome TaxID=1076179 RepID=A0A645EKM9_9ZZZZ